MLGMRNCELGASERSRGRVGCVPVGALAPVSIGRWFGCPWALGQGWCQLHCGAAHRTEHGVLTVHDVTAQQHARPPVYDAAGAAGERQARGGEALLPLARPAVGDGVLGRASSEERRTWMHTADGKRCRDTTTCKGRCTKQHMMTFELRPGMGHGDAVVGRIRHLVTRQQHVHGGLPAGALSQGRVARSPVQQATPCECEAMLLTPG